MELATLCYMMSDWYHWGTIHNNISRKCIHYMNTISGEGLCPGDIKHITYRFPVEQYVLAQSTLP